MSAKEVSFSHQYSLVPKTFFKNTAKKLEKEIQQLSAVVADGSYNDPRGSVNLIDDTRYYESVLDVIHEKKSLNPALVVVIGIGGSNLGTMAVQEAILGKLQVASSVPQIVYADTVDSLHIQKIALLMEHYLRKGNNILLNIVSKSGATTETIANFEYLLAVLKRVRADYSKYVVVTTDKDSPLYKHAKTEKYTILEIPKQVGGRYSVFSAVGLFPLGLLGIDLVALRKGALTMRTRCLSEKIEKNPAALAALVTFYHYGKKVRIEDSIVYGNNFESMGKWYRQLVSESLGKEHDRNGKLVRSGITPTVSTCSTDFHSMAQLYLGGPRNKLFNFIRLSSLNESIELPNESAFDTLVPNLQGKSLDTIMDAIYIGIERAFVKEKQPFTEILLENNTPESIGQLLQFLMMKIIYLGYLLKLNPFDQPAVEKYKQETRKILSKS